MENLKESSDLLAALSDGMADAVEKIGASVVRVNGRRRRPASGVVYAPDMVLTTSHALEREEDLSVGASDGRTLPARFAGRDPSTDLAALRVEGLDVEAAAPAESLAFLLVGTAVLLPIILAYTGYSYWVFRGKVDPHHGYH